MEVIADFLKWVFTFVFYPGLIVGIFLFIIGTIIVLYHKTDNVRIILASFLPLVMLVFFVISDANENSIRLMLENADIWIHLLSGLILGVTVIEFGNLVSRSLQPVSVALYCFYLSFIGIFLLYCIMTTAIQTIHELLFVFVISAGFYAIFRGIPGMSDTLHE